MTNRSKVTPQLSVTDRSAKKSPDTNFPEKTDENKIITRSPDENDNDTKENTGPKTNIIWNKFDVLHNFLNPQPETKSGRIIQMLGIVFFAVLVIVGITVQVYTDAELSTARSEKTKEINLCRNLVNTVFDIIELMGKEMEVMYEYNNGSYDLFLAKAQDIMRVLDQSLIKNTLWPSAIDFETVSPPLRVNITSTDVLRSALKAQRDLRRSPLGVPEVDIIKFYNIKDQPISLCLKKNNPKDLKKWIAILGCTNIDQLSIVGRSLASKAPRFPGWQTFLAVTPTFQTWINFKKYSSIGRKLAYENRTMDTSDPLFRSLLENYQRYYQFLGVASSMSSYAREKVVNLTAQESYKDVEKMQAVVLGLDFNFIDGWTFGETMIRHDVNMQWVLASLRARVEESLLKHIDDWPYEDIFSVPMFAISAAIALGGLIVHIVSTWFQQDQIVQYHKNLHELKEALALVYDCIPKGLIKKASLNTIMPMQRFEDTCVMIMDIFNIEDMITDLETKEFVAVMEETFELVESCLRKYNCFKIDISGNYFIFGSGTGEFHVFDHVLELVFVALDLQDAVAEMKDMKGNDYDVRLRIGIHVGSCYSRVVYLQIPRMAIIGDALQTATLIHATGLAMKVQVSSPVYRRLATSSNELDFIHRGRIIAGSDNKAVADVYWVKWVDESRIDQADKSSVASFS